MFPQVPPVLRALGSRIRGGCTLGGLFCSQLERLSSAFDPQLGVWCWMIRWGWDMYVYIQVISCICFLYMSIYIYTCRWGYMKYSELDDRCHQSAFSINCSALVTFLFRWGSSKCLWYMQQSRMSIFRITGMVKAQAILVSLFVAVT